MDVSSAGGGDADGGSAVVRPVSLVEGDAPLETLTVAAASVWQRAYLLEGGERVSWELRVLEDYDAIFSSRVSCSGLQQGADRSREVTERERGGEFQGFLDLGKEHSDWLQALGAAPGGSPSAAASGGAAAVLVLELDNYYSYFTGKKVELRISKRRSAAMKAKTFQEVLEACEPNTRWEHALRLLGRMREVNVKPDLKTYNAAMSVCRDSRQWEATLQLLEEMRAAGTEPDAASYDIAISACERGGQADLALKLLDGLDAVLTGGGGGGRAPAGGAAGAPGARRLADDGGGDDVAFLRTALREAVGRCPAEAKAVLGHLLAAQDSLEQFAKASADSGDK